MQEDTLLTLPLILASKGLTQLYEMAERIDVLDPYPILNKAAAELRSQGPVGSNQLALMLGELLRCRSPKLLDIVCVAGLLRPTGTLARTVLAIAVARNRGPCPRWPAFLPEFVDVDEKHVWWHGQSGKDIRSNARRALWRMLGRLLAMSIDRLE